MDVTDSDGTFELQIIAFRIDDAELEAFLQHPLGEKRGETRLSAAGIASDQHGLIGIEVDFPPVAICADEEPPPVRRDELGVFGCHAIDQFHHARAMIAGKDDVRLVLQRRQGVGDHRGAPRGSQEGVIVLGVAHRDGVDRRDVEFLQCRMQAARLADPGRQNHDRALVEDHVQFEAKLLNGCEDSLLVGMPGCNHYMADRDRLHAEIDEPLDERRGRGGRKGMFAARFGIVDDGAVFGHDAVEDRKVREGVAQVDKLPSGDEHQHTAGLLEPLKGPQGRVGDRPVFCYGAIVIHGQREEVQRPSCRGGGSLGPRRFHHVIHQPLGPLRKGLQKALRSMVKQCHRLR